MAGAIINWSEELPDDCPPKGAYKPNGLLFYRLVESFPPTDIDFHSIRKRSPNRIVDDISECILRACSVFSTYEACNKTRKTYWKLRRMKIVKLVLQSESGLILPTFRDPHHYSWWRCKNFDPIPHCEEAE